MALPPYAGPEAAVQAVFCDEHQIFVVDLETVRCLVRASRPFLGGGALFVCLYVVFGFPRSAAKAAGGRGIVMAVRTYTGRPARAAGTLRRGDCMTVSSRASTYQHREAAARRAQCGAAVAGAALLGGAALGGRSMAVRRRLGWRSSSAARPPTVWRRRSAHWRQGWRFSRRCWGHQAGVAAGGGRHGAAACRWQHKSRCAPAA